MIKTIRESKIIRKAVVVGLAGLLLNGAVYIDGAIRFDLPDNSVTASIIDDKEEQEKIRQAGEAVPGKIKTYYNRNKKLIKVGILPGTLPPERLKRRTPRLHYRGTPKTADFYYGRKTTRERLSEGTLTPYLPSKSSYRYAAPIPQKPSALQRKTDQKVTWEKLRNLAEERRRRKKASPPRYKKIPAIAEYARKYSLKQTLQNAREQRKKLEEERKKWERRAPERPLMKSRLRFNDASNTAVIRFRGKTIRVGKMLLR